MKITARVFILIGILVINAHDALAFGPPSVEANTDGIKHYQAEQFDEAFSGFADALARDPFNPNYHLNLGDTFLKGGDLPKAMAEFEAVEQNPKAPPELKFKSMFNAGNAAVEAKDIPKALHYYQRALDFKPDSIETKTNIELALKEEQKQKDKKDDKDQDKKGGEGEDQKEKKDRKDGDGQNQKDKKDQKHPQEHDNKTPPQPTPRPTPQGFKSKDLNENDVRRILDELKRQEQEIRARQYKENKNAPESQIEKDW